MIEAHRVENLVDTTGAGDLYASGFLFGLSRGLDLATCGRLGSLAAAEVDSHVGARPVVPLGDGGGVGARLNEARRSDSRATGGLHGASDGSRIPGGQ